MTIRANMLASGAGWQAHEFVCSAGPSDRPFEEMYKGFSISAVTSGTFQYRSSDGDAILAPGSLLLGNHGTCYQCGHAHGVGDRCLSFHYEPEFFESLLADVAGSEARPALVVGFAAETGDVEANARAKLEGKRLDLVCANRVGVEGSGFESDDNALVVYGHDFERALGPASKAELADDLLDLVLERLAPERLP